MKRKILLLSVLIVFSFWGCRNKEEAAPAEDESKVEVVQEETSQAIGDNASDTEDAGNMDGEVDSKNAYEYSKLESILQELKRETD